MMKGTSTEAVWILTDAPFDMAAPIIGASGLKENEKLGCNGVFFGDWLTLLASITLPRSPAGDSSSILGDCFYNFRNSDKPSQNDEQGMRRRGMGPDNGIPKEDITPNKLADRE